MTAMTSLDVESTVSASLPMLLLLLKATCLLLAALGASVLLHRASAGMRHLVWLVAVAALLLLPVVATWSPLRLEILPAALGREAATTPSLLPGANDHSSAAEQSRTDRVLAESAPRIGPDGVSQPSREIGTEVSAGSQGTAPASLTLRSAATTALAIWAAVAAILAGWLAFGALSVRRIVRRARPLSSPDWQAPLYEIADRFGLSDAPRLLRSDDVKMPFASGLLHPTIVLPAEADGWSADRRSAVLLHELGHVRRRDLVGHTLGRLACAIYWFHPLVWTAARRLRSESERACDDLALTCGARPSEYAEHLLEIVSCVRNHATPAVALAMAHRKEFEGRMLAILDPELRRKGPSRVQSLSLVGGLVALSLVVSAAAPSVRPASAAVPAVPQTATLEGTASDTARADATDSQASVVVRTSTRRDMSTSSVVRRSVGAAAASPAPVASAEPEDRSTDATIHGSSIERRADELLRRLAAPTVRDAPASQQSRDERPALLANILRTDSSAELRRIAAWGLNEYAETTVAVDALVDALRRDTDATVREMAAWSLADADDDGKAADALVAALKDSDARVQATAIWALGNVGVPDAVPAVAQSLGSEDARVRELAAWAIGSIEPNRAPAALVTALGDPDPDVRRAVAWAFYQIEDTDAVPALDAALKKETDRETQLAFIRALAVMGERSLDAIRRLLDSKDHDVRTTAIRALAGGSISPWPWPRPRPRPNP